MLATPEPTSRRVALRRIGTFAATGIGLLMFNPARHAAADTGGQQGRPAAGRQPGGSVQPDSFCNISCTPVNCGSTGCAGNVHIFSCHNRCKDTTTSSCMSHACTAFCAQTLTVCPA
jgi:hypothetical protein